MKFFWKVVVFVMFALLLLLDQTYAERGISVIADLTHKNPDIGTYKALIIGINQYQDEAIPNLETAVSDAKSMAKLLRTRYGFSIDDSKDLLIDHKASREAIYNALRALTASADPSDSVLIYYAGHGAMDTLYKGDGWWIPADAKDGDPLSYLDNTQVQNAMRNMRARHVLLISDSCYSGTLFGRGRSLPKVIDDTYYLGLFNEKSRWGITSGNKTPVADQGTNGHSVFAYQFLKALRENQKPFISTQEIFTQIAPIISNNSEMDQVPMCKPVLRTGDQGGQFIFVAIDSRSRESTAKPSKTVLTVNANISGAKVYIDESYLGQTPVNDKEIASGRHKVRVIKQGYRPYHREILFDKGRKKSLQAVLEREAIDKGRISIRTYPENAAIKILNIRPKFYQGIELAPGDYHLEVSNDGYETTAFWISLVAEEDKEIDIHLNPLSAQPNQNSLGMTFVYIPAGSFIMGSPQDEKGRETDEIQHEVTLTNGFYMQTTEVTQKQWQALMGKNPSKFNKCGKTCPVEQVSWREVNIFIQKLNLKEPDRIYRLPTEAQWEYAARSGSAKAFANGDITEAGCQKDPSLDAMGWYCHNSNKSTHPVARKSPNSWGLYDMHGNVSEWVYDWYDRNYYLDSPPTDPEKSTIGAGHVLRGGNWLYSARYCRSAQRHSSSSTKPNDTNGFRLIYIHKKTL